MHDTFFYLVDLARRVADALVVCEHLMREYPTDAEAFLLAGLLTEHVG